MRAQLLPLLCCPSCGGTFVQERVELRDSEITAGILRCERCAESYPVVGGIPRLNREMQGLENVAQTFSYEWKAHHEGRFESATLFGRTEEEDWAFFLECLGARPEDLRGAVVLDAGCGSGRFSRLIAEHGAAMVVAMDINDAVDEAAQACSNVPNVHLVQGNILAIPLKPSSFDMIWSSGVIHHTPDAAAAHRALSRCVKPGGTLYVWVYAKRFNPFRLVKSVFDALRITKLPQPMLLVLSKAISYPSMLALWIYRLIRAVPGLRTRTARAARTTRPRNLGEVQLTWFDALAPEHDSRHTEAEVIGWFEREGFERIATLEEPKVGVRGVAPTHVTS